MANVNKTPFNELPHEEAFHPVRGRIWQSIFNLLDQNRTKLGGDSDYIVSLQDNLQTTAASTISVQAQHNELRADLASISTQIRNLEKKVQSLIAEIRTNG